MARWVIDLDGVMWWGERPVPGAATAVGRLLAAGHDVVFCTNHALSPAAKWAQLAAHGVPAGPSVVTSAEAAAARCPTAGTVLVLGEPTLAEVVAATGRAVLDARDVDPEAGVPDDVSAVVVGGHGEWDRSRFGWAADAVRAGARFLATNADPTFPVQGPGGGRLVPGNGAIVAAVAAAGGSEPEVCGKPHAPMVDLLEDRHGTVDVVVGDLPLTDGHLARALGARFALVLSGVARPEGPWDPEPDLVAADLAELVERELAAPGAARR